VSNSANATPRFATAARFVTLAAVPSNHKGSSAANSQLSLGIKDSDLSGAFVCMAIFSANYLHQHFGKSVEFPTIEDVRPIYEKVKNRWLEEFVGLCKRPEAYTRTQFLDPLLNEIGWTFIPEQHLPSKGITRKRPDYCLFLNDEARQRAAKETETADVFRESATVLEAKRVQHSLDEVSDSETPGWFPSQQVQDYLRNAKDKTGQRYFNWAILTNGNEWRLYCEQPNNFQFCRMAVICSLLADGAKADFACHSGNGGRVEFGGCFCRCQDSRFKD
jgi:hypothetical protein